MTAPGSPITFGADRSYHSTAIRSTVGFAYHGAPPCGVHHVYEGASLGSPPLTGVQTVSVPPGGATVVDFKIARPGRFSIVDHALSRLERGLVGFLIVEGAQDDGIMHQGPARQ